MDPLNGALDRFTGISTCIPLSANAVKPRIPRCHRANRRSIWPIVL